MVHSQFLFSENVFIWFYLCMKIDPGIKSKFRVIFPYHFVLVHCLLTFVFIVEEFVVNLIVFPVMSICLFLLKILFLCLTSVPEDHQPFF